MRKSKGKGRDIGGGDLISIAVKTAVIDVAASGDFIRLDDNDWHCFTVSHYGRASVSRDLEKAPVHHIVD